MLLGLALGIGWLLTLFLPFDLFQGTLLALLALMTLASIVYNLFRGFPVEYTTSEYDEEAYFDDEIPPRRFYTHNREKTWEAWVRYQIANIIYEEFQESPRRIAPMGNSQLQELAIRLADITVSILKTRSPTTTTLNITKNALKKQMKKIGQRPYDDDILGLATTAINDGLDYYYEEVLEVIQAKAWNQPTDMFETH